MLGEPGGVGIAEVVVPAGAVVVVRNVSASLPLPTAINAAAMSATTPIVADDDRSLPPHASLRSVRSRMTKDRPTLPSLRRRSRGEAR